MIHAATSLAGACSWRLAAAEPDFRRMDLNDGSSRWAVAGRQRSGCVPPLRPSRRAPAPSAWNASGIRCRRFSQNMKCSRLRFYGADFCKECLVRSLIERTASPLNVPCVDGRPDRVTPLYESGISRGEIAHQRRKAFPEGIDLSSASSFTNRNRDRSTSSPAVRTKAIPISLR